MKFLNCHIKKARAFSCTGFFFIFFLSGFISNAQVTYYWRNTAANGNWNDANNWWRGYTEVPGGNEILIFDNNTQTTTTNNLANTSRFQINFVAGASTSRTLNGATTNTFYDYGGTAPSINNSSGSNHTISFPFLNGNSNGANRLEVNANSGNITITSTIAGSGGTRNLVGTGAANTFFNGVISNGSGSTINFIKEGSGSATLGASNTYTGSTTISAGTLLLNASSVLPTTNSVTINGGTLSISVAGALSSTNNISLTSGSLQIGNVAASSNVNIGTLAITGGTTIDMGNGSNAFNLNIANTSGLGSGNLTINNWTPSANKKIFITTTTHISTVLASINFTGYGIGAKLLPTNELVPALLYVTQATGSGNFSNSGSWLNGAPSLSNGTESIYIQSGFNLTQDQNFTVLNAEVGGTLTMNGTNTLSITTAGNLKHTGTINLLAASNLNIGTNATWTNTTGTFTGSASGTINFAGGNTISGTVSWPTVAISGSVNFGTGSTIKNGGSLIINNGGVVTTNPPAYATGSTLVYNTTGTYNRSVEWPAGTTVTVIPYHVEVRTGGLNLNVGASGTNERRCTGDLTVNGNFYIGTTNYDDLYVGGNVNLNAGGLLQLGGWNAGVAGDLFLAGHWYHNGGTFDANERAIWFNGSAGDQTVNYSGTEIFGYFIIQKASGNVVMNCDAEIRGGNSGYPLQLLNGNWDLKGRTVTFYMYYDGTLHDISIAGGGTRQVISSSGTGTLYFKHEDATQRISTIASSASTLLSFSSGVIVAIGTPAGFANGGVDFGSAITTINGTLRIDRRGFVETNPPTYATNSLLLYNIGGNYNRKDEWKTSTGPGYPYNVQLSTTGTRLITGGSTNTGVALNLAGSLTIDAGTTFDMSNSAANDMTVPLTAGLDINISGTLIASQAAGGNVMLGRSWTRNTGGVFTQYTRSVTFNTSNNGTLTAPTGGETFYDVVINKPNTGSAPTTFVGYTITLNSPLSITNALTFTSGYFVTGATNILTMGAGSSSSGGGYESFVSGPMKKVGTTNYTFPVGKIVGSEYHYGPIGIGSLGATSYEYTTEYKRASGYTQGPISAAATAAGLSHISRCEYWDLTRTGGPATIAVTLSWSSNAYWPSNCYNNAYVDNVPKLVVVPFKSNNEWGDNFGQNSTGTGNQPYISTITWNAAVDYNKFILGSIDWRFNPLPFNLLKFTALAKASTVDLEWTVNGNDEQQEYVLEKSVDGIHFTELVRVAALDNLATASYLRTDLQPVNGLNHYRVTAYSKTGEFRKSQVIQVWFGQKQGKLSVFPNPVTGTQVNLVTAGLLKGVYNVQLLAADGKLLLSTRLVHDGLQSVQSVQLPVTMSKGVYWLQLSNDRMQPVQFKIMKQ